MLITGKDPKEELDVLRACQWIGQAWNSLNGTRTVMRCFEKAGFRHEKAAPVVVPAVEAVAYQADNDEEAQLLADEALVANPNTVADLEVIVDELIAEETRTNLEAQEQLEEKAPQIEELEISAPCLSTTEAFKTMVDLERFFFHKGMLDEASWLSDKAEQVRRMTPQWQKQSDMRQFFAVPKQE